METVSRKIWTQSDHDTWKMLFDRLDHCRSHQAHPIFELGVEALKITGNQIPDLDAVNERLTARTGWRGEFVDGLVNGKEFLLDLAHKKFPVGNFIRNRDDLNYTPAPDVFHDLYGHLTFLADRDYADFFVNLGNLVSKHQDFPQRVRMCERLFWFGVEFPLVETPKGRRIFGGGIVSSFGESNFSLSNEPEVVPFDLKDIVFRDYNIDEMQRRLFVLKCPEELYSCLGTLNSLIQGVP